MTAPPPRPGAASSLRLTPLGGVGRFGRNCLLLELADGGAGERGAGERGPALIVDCGVRFVADEAPGFDVGLPDLERIAALGERLLAYVVTHGHEDHIGGLPYAIRENRKPIYCTRFTARLIERRFQRTGDALPAVDVVALGAAGSSERASTRRIGPFQVTWLAVSHSIPDASCVVIDTPLGSVVHSGDFRVDEDPVLGPRTDLAGLAAAGDAGVLCLLADSTGALIDGLNPGERSVYAPLLASIEGARGRVVVSLFASHVQRMVLVADAARATGRKLALLGAGLRETVRAARELGLLGIDDVVVDEGELARLPRERVLAAATGSQGEEESALARIARGEHPFLALEPGDRVVLSSRVIPGNEMRVIAITEALAEAGIDVVDGRDSPHVSGHGYAGDLELLLSATRPRTFVALHGNPRNLLAHGALAAAAGLEGGRVVGLRDGASLVLHGDGAVEHLPSVRAHEPLAAHGVVELFAKDAIAQRKRMGSAGVLVVVGGADGARLMWRGTAPALPEDVLREVREAATHALAAAGSADEPAAVKSIARHFRRAGRPTPEIVLVPSTPTTAPSA